MRYSDLIKLNRILGMLGSDHAGERAAAALAADRLVKSMRTSWWGLIGTDPAPRRSASPNAIVTRHELGVDHARAAESRIRQLRTENDLLRKEIASLRNRLSNLTAQERRARYGETQQATEYQA